MPSARSGNSTMFSMTTVTRAEYDRAWYAANKDRKSVTVKAWREANKEHAATTAKVWYAANKEHVASVSKARREANKEQGVDLPGICGERFRFYAARASN
jgi:hypothetical protein